MKLKELKAITIAEHSRKLKYKYNELGRLIDLLRKRDLHAETVDYINQDIEGINSFSGSDRELLKKVRNGELRY